MNKYDDFILSLFTFSSLLSFHLSPYLNLRHNNILGPVKYTYCDFTFLDDEFESKRNKYSLELFNFFTIKISTNKVV